MRLLLATALLCLLPLAAQARPSPYPAVDQFSGDRYVARVAQAPNAQEVVQRVKERRGKVRYLYRVKKRPVPVPRQRPAVAPETRAGESGAEPLSVWAGAKREAQRALGVIGGRPAGCPRAFCGCGASLYLFGRIIPRLNLAANWLRFPRAAPGPKMVAARRGHVFVLEQHIRGNVWLVHDSNSGGHKTRLHPRSIAGYVIVNPRGPA